MGRKKTWIRVYGIPDPSEMEKLCRMGIYYNGKGYYRCESPAAADEGLKHFRANGLEAERSKGPTSPRFTHKEAFIVGRSMERSPRFSLF